MIQSLTSVYMLHVQCHVTCTRFSLPLLPAPLLKQLHAVVKALNLINSRHVQVQYCRNVVTSLSCGCRIKQKILCVQLYD